MAESERMQLKAGQAGAPETSQFKISRQDYLQALIPPSNEDKRLVVSLSTVGGSQDLYKMLRNNVQHDNKIRYAGLEAVFV